VANITDVLEKGTGKCGSLPRPKIDKEKDK